MMNVLVGMCGKYELEREACCIYPRQYDHTTYHHQTTFPRDWANRRMKLTVITCARELFVPNHGTDGVGLLQQSMTASPTNL